MKTRTIFFAGLLVGSFDIIAAFIDFYITTGNGPSGVLRFIASGAFGNKAFTGGTIMIFWGLAFHYLIAYSFTIMFFWLYQKVKHASANPITTVVIYGIFMWVITTLIIVPLSNTPSIPLSFWKAVKSILILIFTVSLPLYLIAKREV